MTGGKRCQTSIVFPNVLALACARNNSTSPPAPLATLDNIFNPRSIKHHLKVSPSLQLRKLHHCNPTSSLLHHVWKARSRIKIPARYKNMRDFWGWFPPRTIDVNGNSREVFDEFATIVSPQVNNGHRPGSRPFHRQTCCPGNFSRSRLKALGLLGHRITSRGITGCGITSRPTRLKQ